MVETSKQVRVDNWGIYFLQRLQLFFSKTDYCDLTLQFEGNVQLKVHRLVMNACTEYFAFLEQTCPALEENTIMMPADLQADVIVPIVNFMYTGMLEFHPSIYDKLYRAAEIMNIAVLTKLLEAQIPPINRTVGRPKRERDKDISNWKEYKKVSKPGTLFTNELPAALPGKKLPVWKKRNPSNVSLQSHPASATFTTNKWNSDPIESISDNTPKPTRFEWPEDDFTPISAMYPSFDDVSLTSKPLWTKEDDQKAGPTEESPKVLQYPARRKSDSISQDYEEEFIEKEQKVNLSQLEVSLPIETPIKRKAENKVTSSPKRVKISNQDEETIISITTSNPSEVDHTKIVSEILKKYPDLVKKKRNIKLKITQSKTEQSQIKVQTVREKVKSAQFPSPVEKVIQPTPAKEIKRDVTATKTSPPSKEVLPGRIVSRKGNFKAASEEGPWTCMECFGQDREGAEFVLYYLFRKHMADQHQVEFDSTLCKYCGKKCPKQNFMTYHLYTKHGLKPPRNVTFPKCTSCPFIAVTTELLEEHMKTHGKDEVQCLSCQLGFLSKKELMGHQQMSGHNNRASSILDCAYCLKKLQSPVTLFSHVRVQHMKEARRDGVTSLDEPMDVKSEDIEEEVQEKEEVAAISHYEKPADIHEAKGEQQEKQSLKERVKIISNVKVDRTDDGISDTRENKAADVTALHEPEPEPEAVAVTTTAAALSNIGGSLATNLGLVDIVVLDDNQQYILQQPQGQPGNAEFILPPELTSSQGILQAAAASGELNSTDELVMVLTDHDYQDEQNTGQSDNSNIVVLYSHPVEGQQGQFITSQGNLLVNSEGMLEIRNGAAITTTAGQILVNNDTTTTTQATQSPIESIDLIRKEIEGSDEVERERENIKTVLSEKNMCYETNNKTEPEDVSPPTEINSHHTDNSMVNSYDDTKKDEDAIADTTDSSTQEEPMEVDEIGPPQKAVVEEASNGQEETPTINSTDENKQQEFVQENVEISNNTIGVDELQGQDVPPDINRIPQANQETKETSIPRIDTEVVLNDPNNQQIHDSKTLEQEEQMEVDNGQSENAPAESVSGLDELDTGVPEEPTILSNIDNTIQEPIENCSEEDQNHEHPDQLIQEETNNQPDQTEVQEIQNQISETSLEENVEKSQEESSNPENDKECDSEIGPETLIEQNQEETGPIENDVNDSNDNIQPNYDDFTDESQQSSGQKTHKDLNKEILDDWDDTDSQQSQSQEQDSQETEQDHAALNAAENVNKLMDDWDEEDEDQTKQ